MDRQLDKGDQQVKEIQVGFVKGTAKGIGKGIGGLFSRKSKKAAAAAAEEAAKAEGLEREAAKAARCAKKRSAARWLPPRAARSPLLRNGPLSARSCVPLHPTPVRPRALSYNARTADFRAFVSGRDAERKAAATSGSDHIAAAQSRFGSKARPCPALARDAIFALRRALRHVARLVIRACLLACPSAAFRCRHATVSCVKCSTLALCTSLLPSDGRAPLLPRSPSPAPCDTPSASTVTRGEPPLRLLPGY